VRHSLLGGINRHQDVCPLFLIFYMPSYYQKNRLFVDIIYKKYNHYLITI